MYLSTTQSNKQFGVKKIVTLGMLSALGVLLAMMIEFPLFPAVAPFLKYDPADIPILIASMLYGPASGFMTTVVISFLQSLMHGSGGIIGFVMHVAATGAMAIVVGLLYTKRPTKSGTVWSLACGSLAMTLVMVGLNLVLTPIFLQTPIEVVKAMLVPVIIPFNLLKAGLNSAATFVVFHMIQKIIQKD